MALTSASTQRRRRSRFTKDFDPLPGQKHFLESTEPELLYSGAFGAGKSRVLCEKALLLSILYPGNFGGIFRKTRKSLTHTTLRSFLKDVCPPLIIADYNKSEDIITLTNGSQIIFGGLDDPTKWGSLELGFVGIDELIELTEDDYMMLLGRLRLKRTMKGKILPFRQAFSATNPASPTHWVYQRFYIQGVGQVVESNALENIHNPPDYVARLEGFKGRYRERYVWGKWVSFEGLVYDVFDPLLHVIDNMPEGWHKWTKIRSIDFGYTSPFVCQWWAVSPDDEWYLYREIYYSHRLVEEHARQIIELSEGETYMATFADHDAEDRATLEKNGVSTQPAAKDVGPGIQEVYSRLKPDERGRPRLYFLRNALVEKDYSLEAARKPTCTIEEIQGYTWAPAREGRNSKEEPVKVNDHGMDAMRYAIYSFSNAAPLTDRQRNLFKGASLYG